MSIDRYDTFIKEFRKYLITDGKVSWIDHGAGVKWHLTVTSREKIIEEKPEEAQNTTKKDSSLTKWLKDD